MSARATHEGELAIGSGVPCAVLDSGQRVLTLRGAARVLGLGSGGSRLARFIGQARLAPHLEWVGQSAKRSGARGSQAAGSARNGVGQFIEFTAADGSAAQGIDVRTVVSIARAVVRADREGDLTAAQRGAVEAAVALLDALAEVGIAALVDEATGYRAELSDDDYVRMFVRQLPAGWARRFPPSFYTALSQVTGLRPRGHTRPNRWAQLTNQFVYSRLKPSVQAELRRLADQHGARMHQFISEEADRALDALIDTATRCMLAHRSVEPALAMMDKIYPVEGAGVVVAPKGRAANQLMFAFEGAV